MKRPVAAIAIASFVLATAAPAFAVDPVDPAGNPVSTEGSIEPSDSVSAQMAQQVHANGADSGCFQRRATVMSA